MNTYISLLRGINVSGQKMIRMPDPQRHYEGLGLTRVRTYLQSGNVVFNAPAPDSADFAVQLAAQISLKAVSGWPGPRGPSTRASPLPQSRCQPRVQTP